MPSNFGFLPSLHVLGTGCRSEKQRYRLEMFAETVELSFFIQSTARQVSRIYLDLKAKFFRRKYCEFTRLYQAYFIFSFRWLYHVRVLIQIEKDPFPNTYPFYFELLHPQFLDTNVKYGTAFFVKLFPEEK